MLGDTRHYCNCFVLHMPFFFLFPNTSVLKFLVAFWSWMSFCPLVFCGSFFCVKVQLLKFKLGKKMRRALFSIFSMLFSPEAKLCQRIDALKEKWESSYVRDNSLLILIILCALHTFVVTLLCCCLGYFLTFVMFKKSNKIVTCNGNPSFCM